VPAPLVGLTSLAAGADQLFAECVLARGGALHVILPFADYDHELEPPVRARFYALLGRATTVRTLSGHASKDAAYDEAGQLVVQGAEQLVAVWDGLPARGLGGTADAVDCARRLGRPVLHVNPVRRVTGWLPD